MRSVGTALLMLSLHAGTVGAQHAAIEQCRKTSSDADRITCLEAALLERDGETQSPPEPVAVSEPRLVVDDAAPTVQDFGLKDKQPPREMNTVRVIVTSVRKNLSGKIVFKTEDGQVWQQTGQRTVRFDDTPFEAEIRPASMGSFFLKSESGGVSVRVRREK